LRIRTPASARLFIRILPLVLFSVMAFHLCAWAQQQNPTNPPTQPSPFRLINSASGSKEVTKDAVETIEDPRTVFHVPEDTKIVVAFELEGPTGAHHLQGSWRNPEGNVVSVGDVDMQTYTPKFFCYFSLTFPESVTPGLWALELQVDGHPSGVHTFEIVAKPKPPPPPPPVSPPSTADVYQRVVAASVFIDNLDSGGELLRQGSGFFIGQNLLLTAFQVIDGASSLQIDFPDGSHTTTNQVLIWNRWQDWAILKADAPKSPPLERAKTGSWKVGDVCYLLGAPNESSRTIQNVGITGFQQSAETGERLSVSWTGSRLTIGSPLLDDYGRVVGILGGTLIPGVDSLYRAGGRPFMDAGLAPENSATPLVVPISMVPEQLNSAQPAMLSALMGQGAFIKPLSQDTQVLSGYLCRSYRKFGATTLIPGDRTLEFSRSHDSLGIVVTWTPDKKIKSTMQFQIYDLDNHMVAQTPPDKIELQTRATTYSGTKFSLTSFKPGVYRIDLLLGDLPQWRGFFRVQQ
jgi:hypothetical protein